MEHVGTILVVEFVLNLFLKAVVEEAYKPVLVDFVASPSGIEYCKLLLT